MAMRINTNIAALNALRHLNRTEKETAATLERLSSGRRINRASDGPAALVISEQMKAQVSSIDQAIANSETSVSMLQTAEGALNEVSNILVNLRQLAVHAANEGTNDTRMLQADQSEIQNLLATLGRISDTTQFGRRSLLNGSNAATGVAVGDGLEFVSATENTKPSPAEGYKINITQVPTRAMAVAQNLMELEDVATGNNLSFVIAEGGKSVALSVNTDRELRMKIDQILQSALRDKDPMDKTQARQTIQHLLATKLQEKVKEAGLELDVFIYKPVEHFGEVLSDWDEQEDVLTQIAEYPGNLKDLTDEEVLVIRHRQFGSEATFTVTTSLNDFFDEEAPANKAVSATPGRDIEGTIGGNPEFEAGSPALGKGQILSAAPGTEAEGLTIKYTRDTDDVINEVFNRKDLKVNGIFREIKDNATLVGKDKPGTLFNGVSAEIDGFVHVTQGSLAFQVGPNQGQQVKISIPSIRPTELATGLKNSSGFQNLGDISVTSGKEAQDSLALIDAAIEEVAGMRAKLGAFQKNALESNLNSLRISKENLTAAESELGDADMAAEMSNFVKNQILLQSGTAMLAQANQIPQSVLQLLNAGK